MDDTNLMSMIMKGPASGGGNGDGFDGTPPPGPNDPTSPAAVDGRDK